MNNAMAYAEAVDRDFQDNNYFKNILPEWLGQEEDACTTGDDTAGDVPPEIRLLDRQLDAADPDMNDTAVTAESEEACFDAGPGLTEDEETCPGEEESMDCGAYGPGDYSGDFDFDEYDDSEYESEMDLIDEDIFSYSDDWARSEDTGWFYED